MAYVSILPRTRSSWRFHVALAITASYAGVSLLLSLLSSSAFMPRIWAARSLKAVTKVLPCVSTAISVRMYR